QPPHFVPAGQPARDVPPFRRLVRGRARRREPEGTGADRVAHLTLHRAQVVLSRRSPEGAPAHHVGTDGRGADRPPEVRRLGDPPAGTLADPPARDDAAVPYAHVGPIPRQTGSVDHRAVLDHQVVGHSDLRASLALTLGAIGDLDGFLLEVEAERLLALDVAAGDPDEERVVAVLDRMDVADRE